MSNQYSRNFKLLDNLTLRLCKLIILTFISILVMTDFTLSAQLPKPSGEYTVGTAYWHFTDTTRQELFTDDDSDFREIFCRIWYPAQAVKKLTAANYIPDDLKQYSRQYLPVKMFDIKTNSYENIPIAEKYRPFPIIIYSHGWGEYIEHYTSMMEELASQGYIVFSISHNFEAKFWGYDENNLGLFSNKGEAIEKRLAEQQNPEAFKLFQSMPDQHSISEQYAFASKASRELPAFFEESPRNWAEDIICFIDALFKPEIIPEFLDNKLDFSKIAVIGMSIGGLAANLACSLDNRIKVGINLDGGLYGDLLELKISQPILFISSERYRHYNDFFLEHLKSEGFAMVIKGSDHQNFSDQGFIDQNGMLLGSIDQQEMHRIVSTGIKTFLSNFLLNRKTDDLCNLNKTFPKLNCQRK